VSSESRLELLDWSLRASEFRQLREYRGASIVMEYLPTDRVAPEAWDALCELWRELKRHPHVIEPVAVGEGGVLLLRYAAIEWNAPLRPVDTSLVARDAVARWGVQIADAFTMIVARVAEDELWRFLRPVMWVDVEGAARLTFLPVHDGLGVVLPPEARSSQRRCDERSVVYAIGHAMRAHCSGLGAPDASAIAQILDRCVSEKPAQRYRIVEDLRSAWDVLAPGQAVRSGERYRVWSRAEESLGRKVMALPSLVAADRTRERVMRGGITSGSFDSRRLHDIAPPPPPPSPRGPRWSIAWEEAHDVGSRHEQQRAFNEALATYHQARLDGINDAEIYTAIARCQLVLGGAATAVDYAQRALVVQFSLVEAQAIRARGYEKLSRYDDALKSCRSWLAVAPEDADGHYIRGRALLGLHRYVEAREAFDRACALRPTMLEAMLLRREADRLAKLVREDVGEQPALVLDLPEHLAELRELVTNGEIAKLILVLDEPRFEADAAAKLVQARCLVFERRLGEAIARFDRVLEVGPEHARAALLGKAHALLVLHQALDALSLFERVLAQYPGDVEALEGRALALRRLGRDVDAEADERQLFAAAASARG
jgi:tetratricopeptide (TPR) repeat protein